MVSLNRCGNARIPRYDLFTSAGVRSLTPMHTSPQGNEYATYTYPDGRERRTVNGRERLPPQQHVPPQRIQPSPPPPPPPPIQTTSLPPPPPPPPYSNMSRKRD